jgi:hypothetical protein
MLLKPSHISELFKDNNSEQAETDNVTGEEDGSYKEVVSHCYNRSTYPGNGVIQNVPVFMCHMGPVHPVPLKKMTINRVGQINKHQNCQEPHGKHSSQCGTHLYREPQW